MIDGFEELTYKLTKYEKDEVLPRMLEGLKDRKAFTYFFCVW